LKIGFYGGTFDPIHFGHINLAIRIQEFHHLDQILVCPAALSPFKKGSQPVPLQHRLKMVELSIQDIPGFKLLDWEAKRAPPSYTIDTLNALKMHDKQAGINNSYFLILGGDSIAEFPRWKSPQEILTIAPLLIGQREADQVFIREDSPDWLKDAALKGATTIPVMEISGTDIRQRLEKGLYCGDLVPQKVLDYISQYNLY